MMNDERHQRGAELLRAMLHSRRLSQRRVACRVGIDPSLLNLLCTGSWVGSNAQAMGTMLRIGQVLVELDVPRVRVSEWLLACGFVDEETRLDLMASRRSGTCALSADVRRALIDSTPGQREGLAAKVRALCLDTFAR